MIPSNTYGLPAPMPTLDPDNAPFWEATVRGELVLPRCAACDLVLWYPKKFCTGCASSDIAWTKASGLGTVYSYTITHRGAGEYTHVVPYVYAYVELDEGPRIVTNIVDADPADVFIGQRVSAVFDMAGSHAALVRFRPV